MSLDVEWGDGTVTEVQELEIMKAVGASETAIKMRPVELITTPDSLDFVWIGES